MGTIKDRSRMDLKEEEDIQKRWQEYKKNYTKEVLITWITVMAPSLT